MKIKNTIAIALTFGITTLLFGASAFAVNPATSPLQYLEATEKDRPIASLSIASDDNADLTACGYKKNISPNDFAIAFKRIIDNTARFECLVRTYQHLGIANPQFNGKTYTLTSPSTAQTPSTKKY